MQGAPIFKGCTRPAMLWGVPLLPLLLVLGGAAILGAWAGYIVAWWAAVAVFIVAIIAVLTMRDITKKDDQRLKLLLMRLRVRLGQRNFARWKAITFSPIEYKRRK
jgi:type IV secretion system protein VirB3